MLGFSEPGALNFYALFRLISLTLFVSRNLTLIHLPFSKSLDSSLCNLIAPITGLAFILLMPRTLAATSSFSSGRAYPSRNFLPPFFLPADTVPADTCPRTPLISFRTVQPRTFCTARSWATLSLCNLWSRPSGVAQLLGICGPHPSEGDG